MGSLLEDYTSQLFYVGKAYGTEIKMPMWFKNFGRSGAGEAYHIGIFGKNGSGKSVLAKMIMSAYAKHEEMSILILDPQGEFAVDFRSQTQLKAIIHEKLGRDVQVYDLHNLVLTGGYELFKKILMNTKFLDKLGIFHEDNKVRAADEIESILLGRSRGNTGFDRSKLKPWEIYTKAAFDRVWLALETDEVLQKIYTGEPYQDRVKREVKFGDREAYFDLWSKIANLFRYEGKEKSIDINKLVNKIHDENKKVSDVLFNMADAAEDAEIIKFKLLRALFFPVVTFVFGILLLTVITVYVLPVFKDMFGSMGGHLPGPTQALLGVSDWVIQHVVFLLIAFILLLVLFITNKTAACFMRSLFPGFNQLMKRTSAILFTRQLSMMLSFGLPLNQALKNAAGMVKNAAHAKKLAAVADAVSNGRPLGEALASAGIFSNIVLHMINYASESDTLLLALDETIRFYEKDFDRSLHRFLGWVEIGAIFTVGLIIGYIVIAMYLPIFQMAGAIS